MTSPDNEVPIVASLAPTLKTSQDDSRGTLLQSRAVVLGLLFLATGALGIPLLWVNQSFSSKERVVWSVLVTLYTIALLAGTYFIVSWSWQQIQQAY